MKKYFTIVIAFVAWVAVLAQFYLAITNRQNPLEETVIRFFSYFTILTNCMVSIAFSLLAANKKGSFINKPIIITSVTVYIVVVGLVYQTVLRQLTNPTGVQKIVDDLLHLVVPILVLFYWYFCTTKFTLKYALIPKMLLYPLVYLIYILMRGSLSGFYPYPFVDVNAIGLTKVLVNSFYLMLVFSGLSALFILIARLKRERAFSA